MASYEMAQGDVALHAKTLTPNSEDVVLCTDLPPTGRITLILHPGPTAPVYVCTGDQPATVAGAHCRVLFAGWDGDLLGPSGLLRGLAGAGADAPIRLRLISAAAVTYSVEA